MYACECVYVFVVVHRHLHRLVAVFSADGLQATREPSPCGRRSFLPRLPSAPLGRSSLQRKLETRPLRALARYLAAPRLAAVVAAMAQARIRRSGFRPQHRDPSEAVVFIAVLLKGVLVQCCPGS